MEWNVFQHPISANLHIIQCDMILRSLLTTYQPTIWRYVMPSSCDRLMQWLCSISTFSKWSWTFVISCGLPMSCFLNCISPALVVHLLQFMYCLSMCGDFYVPIVIVYHSQCSDVERSYQTYRWHMSIYWSQMTWFSIKYFTTVLSQQKSLSQYILQLCNPVISNITKVLIVIITYICIIKP